MFAEVVAIRDEPQGPSLSDVYRPHYAVDLQPLNQNLEHDKLLPVLTDVAWPVTGAGNGAGFWQFPQRGTVVELAFGYGKAHLPYIRQVVPFGASGPKLHPNESTWQQSEETAQRCDRNGNWTRATHGDITDSADNHKIDATHARVEAHTLNHKIRHSSTEVVGGSKIIKALGRISALAGGHFNISAGGNINTTTAFDLNPTAGRDLKERVKKIADRFAEELQRVKVKDGGKMWVGNESDNSLKILSDLIQVVADIADTAAKHTHPSNGTKPSQEGTFNGQKSSADGLKGKLDVMVE